MPPMPPLPPMTFALQSACAWPLALTVAVALTLLASMAAARADDSAPARVTLYSQALLYGGATTLEESDFNPANALARIPRHQGDAELRLDLGAAKGDCNAAARLRARYQRAGHAEAHALLINQGGVRCRAGGGALEISAGREVLQWGSAFFLSPSNPFFIDTGRTNPIQELVGKDMLQALWFPSQQLTVSLIRKLRHSAREQDTDPQAVSLAPVSALRMDWVGDNASGGAIVSRRDDGVRRLGLYGTLPWSRALVLYAELNAGRGSAGWYPVPDSDGASVRMERSQLHGGELLHTVLAGAAYTLESGWTVNAEWISGNEGYGHAERAAYRQAVASAARAFPQPASLQVLGAALAPNLPYLGANYLFLQLMRSEWQDKGDVALRWTRSFGAGEGTLLSGSFTWYLNNHSQLFLVASRNRGGARSDFGRLVRSSVQTGLRFTF